MKHKKDAFTLVEVLISITLLSLVLMALYKSSDLLRRSNKQLYHHLEHINDAVRGSQTLYLDLLQSDGNITIERKEKSFDRLLIQQTQHSLYGHQTIKVIWLVHKKENTLLRIEGNDYHLPLKSEEHVEIDNISEHIELFKVYRGKKPDKMLLIIKSSGEEVQSFMVQNISLAHYKPKLVSPGDISKQVKKNK